MSSITRLNDECIRCLINKYTVNYPEYADKTTILEYTQNVLRILSEASHETSAPELVAEIKNLKEKYFGIKEDFSKEKVLFNNLALSVEKDTEKKEV